jgi:hypothetical protein
VPCGPELGPTERHPADGPLAAFRKALDEICRDYPHDCATADDWPLKWCEATMPRQYRRIAYQIPDKIDAMLDARVPLPELQALLTEWVSLHVWLYAQFRYALRRS